MPPPALSGSFGQTLASASNSQFPGTRSGYQSIIMSRRPPPYADSTSPARSAPNAPASRYRDCSVSRRTEHTGASPALGSMGSAAQHHCRRRAVRRDGQAPPCDLDHARRQPRQRAGTWCRDARSVNQSPPSSRRRSRRSSIPHMQPCGCGCGCGCPPKLAVRTSTEGGIKSLSVDHHADQPVESTELAKGLKGTDRTPGDRDDERLGWQARPSPMLQITPQHRRTGIGLWRCSGVRDMGHPTRVLCGPLSGRSVQEQSDVRLMRLSRHAVSPSAWSYAARTGLGCRRAILPRCGGWSVVGAALCWVRWLSASR